MLKLGIPCVCINLLGIALQVTNSWAFIPDPIIPDIQCMAVNEWDGNGEGKPAIANGRLNSLFVSTNRWNGTANLPIPTFALTPNAQSGRNDWDNTGDAREVRTFPIPLNSWIPPFQAFNDARLQITNNWTVGTTVEDEIQVYTENIWITDIAAITLFESQLPRNNTWTNNGFQSQADTFIQNNWTFDNLFPAQAQGTNTNQWQNTSNNLEVDVTPVINTWSVETFAIIQAFGLNSWVPIAGNAIIPVVMIFPVNTWDAEGSLPRPINQSVLNNWTGNGTMLGIIRSTLTNTWSNTGSNFSPNIQVSTFNEWSAEADLPDLVITAVGEFINQWGNTIEVDGQVIDECPVPCGMPTVVTKIRFKDIKIGQATEVT